MRRVALAVSLVMAAVVPAQAEPTKVIVRAQSTDAKFIGTSMGGVKILLKDANSGKVLASGLTTGGTGDTARLVTNPPARGVLRSDSSSAGFEAVLDISRPTLVRAEAYGPSGKKDAAVQVSSTLWMLPGRHLTGDGWILMFPGLVVEPELMPGTAGVNVSAKVTLMCGCPLEAGGTWDAANYLVTAHLLDGEREVLRRPLNFSGKASHYSAVLPALPKGKYTLQVTAADKNTVNAGVATRQVTIP